MPNRSRLPSRSALGAAIVSLVALLATCAKEREPRSFVQPNAIKRSDLEGTWYYVQTVTDSPPSNGAAFVGVSSDLMKIKFDVQENTLYARRAYEQINNSEDAKARDAKGYLGQPLAAWRIEGHFDVIRDYNATTGEETNKIIESQERPWTQREFLRVDWSKNLITDYSGIGLQLWFSDAKVEPVSYWESDPSHPDAIHFERATDGPFRVSLGRRRRFVRLDGLRRWRLVLGRGPKRVGVVHAVWVPNLQTSKRGGYPCRDRNFIGLI